MSDTMTLKDPVTSESSTSPRMDVFIAGMGRAGTTLLANLLTRPPHRWILVEPGLTRQDMGEHMRRQAERFGIPISPETWRGVRAEETALERFNRVLLPQMEGIRWGVKEVNMEGVDPLMETFQPRAVLLCVRNIRDCALSVFEKNLRAGKAARTEEWLAERLLSAGRTLVRLKQSLSGETVRVVRYEDFVANSAERERLAEWLDWPLDGEPSWCMDLYGRQDEPLRHGGQIGASSVNRGVRISDPVSLAFAEKVICEAEEYQSAFGYESAISTNGKVVVSIPESPIARLTSGSIEVKTTTAKDRMRCIIGRRHRAKLLSFLKPGSRMLEWGTGGSTVWLADNLPPGATLTSVDHDPKWVAETRKHLEGNPAVRLILKEATGPLGQNATIEEESAAPLHDFVHGADGNQFDVILVDGNARSACLRQAKQLLAPDGVVLLHDAQRAWYDEAKQTFIEYGHIGSCPDYPVPHLWWGGLNEPKASAAREGTLPLVISFYTKNTPYEEEARRLIASCHRNGVEHLVTGLESRGSWEANCSLKAQFIYDTWKTTGRPVLWVDADAVVHQPPELLRGVSADFGIYKCRGWELASGTLFFNQTEEAGALLERWLSRCHRFPKVWDQINLDLAWEDCVSVRPLETLWLPEPYCRIFDLFEGRSTSSAVVEHLQASRRLKTKISSAQPSTRPPETPQLVAARMSSRPRAWRLRSVDGATQPGLQLRVPPHFRLVDGISDSLMDQAIDGLAQAHPRGRVLLLDAGVGSLWRLLQERGFEVHGVGSGTTYVETAAQFCGDHFKAGSTAELPFPNNHFNGVVCFGVLEFLEEPVLDRALRELRRVAGEFLYLILQTSPDPENRWTAPERDLAWWQTKLAAAGFERMLCGDEVPRASATDAGGLVLCLCRTATPGESLAAADFFSRANALIQCGKSHEAISLLQQAVQSHPDAQQCWGTLAQLQLEAGDVAGVILTLQRARQALPADVDVAIALVSLYVQTDRIEEAGTELRAALKLNPDDAQLKQFLAEVRTRLAPDPGTDGQTLSLDLNRAPLAAWSPAELELLVDDILAVCGVSPMLVAGDHASILLRELHRRGIRVTDASWHSGNPRLPFADGATETVVLAGAITAACEDRIQDALSEFRRVSRCSVFACLDGRDRDRVWWMEKFLAAGFRRHPLGNSIQSESKLEGANLLISFESASFSGIPDWSRSTSAGADARQAIYTHAARQVRPGDTVVEIGCESGAGLYLMHRASRGARFIGFDPSEHAIAQARNEWQSRSKLLEFTQATSEGALRLLSGHSVNLLVCLDATAHGLTSDTTLAELRRVLVPGGHLLLGGGAEAVNSGRLHSALERHFYVESVIDAPTGAEGQLFLAMKDPLTLPQPAYRETNFQNVADSGHVSLCYPEFYRNPWIVHSLVHVGYRSTSPRILMDCAQRLLQSEPPDSVDRGAAICLLVYRALEGQLPNGISETVLLDQAQAYLGIAKPNPHQLRWQVSLAYAIGLLHVRAGRHDEARASFERCAALDPLNFSVHLGTKTTEALFWSGWLAFTVGDHSKAESAWKRGLDCGERLKQRPLSETLMQPDWPNLFDYGDGMRELIYALENVARCANGLHALRLEERGVSVRWDLIHNCFRFQHETINRALRIAQNRVTQLCTELAHTREELVHRTSDLNREREALRERGRELDEARELLALNNSLQTTP